MQAIHFPDLALDGPTDATPAPLRPLSSASSYITGAPARAERLFSEGYLPDGTPLRWTLDRLALYREALSADGAAAGGRPQGLADAVVMLFLASQDRTVWSLPRVFSGDAGVLPPLRADAFALLAAVDAWAEQNFQANEEDAILHIARHLWDWHHAGEVQPVESAAASQKKTALPNSSPSGPAAPINSSASSAAETSPNGTGSAQSAPSAISTPAFTAGMSLRGFPSPLHTPPPPPLMNSASDTPPSGSGAVAEKSCTLCAGDGWYWEQTDLEDIKVTCHCKAAPASVTDFQEIPNRWAAEEAAFKNGSKIEIRYFSLAYSRWSDWMPCRDPLFRDDSTTEYRIAEPSPDPVPNTDEDAAYTDAVRQEIRTP